MKDKTDLPVEIWSRNTVAVLKPDGTYHVVHTTPAGECIEMILTPGELEKHMKANRK